MDGAQGQLDPGDTSVLPDPFPILSSGSGWPHSLGRLPVGGAGPPAAPDPKGKVSANVRSGSEPSGFGFGSSLLGSQCNSWGHSRARGLQGGDWSRQDHVTSLKVGVQVAAVGSADPLPPRIMGQRGCKCLPSLAEEGKGSSAGI